MKKTSLESLFDDFGDVSTEPYLTDQDPIPRKSRPKRSKSQIHKVMTRQEAIVYGNWQNEKPTDDELGTIRLLARCLKLSDADVYRIAGDVANRKVANLESDLNRGQACSVIGILKQLEKLRRTSSASDHLGKQSKRQRVRRNIRYRRT